MPFGAYRREHPDATPREVIARFFRGRLSPEFLAAPGTLRAMADRVQREWPAWTERTIRLVREECETGLRIYARSGPPLGAECFWRRLEPGPGGDKLYQKRPHRFAFAPRLALAALYGEPTDSTLETVLRGWMAVAASRTNTIAYDSNLSVIQRLLALSWAWALLAAREAPTLQQLEQEGLVLKTIWSDIEYLVPRLGQSAPNNHLLADVFAGWFIGCVWPELALAEGLRVRFEELWLRELSRQILRDGTSFEHSVHYHEYACEMAVAYVVLSRRNGYEVSEWMLDRTRRMLEFQASLAGPEGIALAVGDASEDPLFPLDSGNGWGTAAWREAHRALFASRLEPSSEESPSRERAFWLLGGGLADVAEAQQSPALTAYPNGGFYVFYDGPADCRLIFRTGPRAGEAVSAGHAHSDLLSVYSSVRGRPIMVDAGTYSYRPGRRGSSEEDRDWRPYLRGPAAHNGLVLGSHDALGRADESFRRPGLETFVAVGRVHDEPVASWVDAVVIGRGPYASHRRGVVRIPGQYFVVYDVLPGSEQGYEKECRFQFSPDIELGPHGVRGVTARHGEARMFLSGSSSVARPVCLTGSMDPVGGWVSRGYGDLTPAPQVSFRVNPNTTTAAFLVQHAVSVSRADIDVEPLGKEGVCIRVSMANSEDLLFLNFGDATAELQRDGIRFRGGLAWLRCHLGVPSVLRWVDGSFFGWPDKGIAIDRQKPCPALEIESTGAGPSLRVGKSETLSIRW